jgi:hypothetical protein
MGNMKSAYKILVGKPERKRPLGRLCIDGMIILLWLLSKFGLHSSGPGKVAVAGYCEWSNEPSGSVKGGEFLD